MSKKILITLLLSVQKHAVVIPSDNAAVILLQGN